MGERRGSIDTLPADARHVRNGAVGMWGNDDGWSLVEEVRRGTLDLEGPELFGDVRLRVDENGCIYRHDTQAKAVSAV
jgi:hypothetical protein